MSKEAPPIIPHQAIESKMLRIAVSPEAIEISSPLCTAFLMEQLRPRLVVNECALNVKTSSCSPLKDEAEGFEIIWEFDPISIQLQQQFTVDENGAIHLQSWLRNNSGNSIQLNQVSLLECDAPHCNFGSGGVLRLYEQSNTSAQVRNSGGKGASVAVMEDPTQVITANGDSQTTWVGYDAAARFGWLVGFSTSHRWDGHIQTHENADGTFAHWQVGFDGGDLLIDPQQELSLEKVLFLAGRDPNVLLEQYGDIVAELHQHKVLPKSPVSWCSWYPYRLGVTEERVLANARIAAQRLRPLGLEYFEVDLGWEENHLPSNYEENSQFPHGLKGLSERLAEQGFKLGIWQGIYTISEFSDIAKEHPEWLLGDAENQPAPQGAWFWVPHGEIYALDLTHPGAQEWLRLNVRSLVQRGGSYFKFDFTSMITTPKLRQRHNPRIVAGGGVEAARIGGLIIEEETQASQEKTLIMNMGAPEIPGVGTGNIFYTCHDTGNTGYTSFSFLSGNYGKNLAGHLWKQGRWAVIQPSCFCVGLPGTLEEARLRATATFLSGGHVDITEDLTTLPEDRWQVLTATLPPSGKAARPVDLFDKIECTSLSYVAMCKGLPDDEDDAPIAANDCSRVWHLPIDAGWDQWHIVGIFNYDRPALDASGSAELITCFQLPYDRLNLDPNETYWAFEFWSGQFLGTLPLDEEDSLAPQGYVHPGDARKMIAMREPGTIELSFFGPSVKLLVLRKARPHPWIVGTSFHQSAGTELSDVQWQPTATGGTLRGVLHRPPGERGDLFIAGADKLPAKVLLGNQETMARPSASGALIISVTTQSSETPWEINW